jgi:hypothetical protein
MTMQAFSAVQQFIAVMQQIIATRAIQRTHAGTTIIIMTCSVQRVRKALHLLVHDDKSWYRIW